MDAVYNKGAALQQIYVQRIIQSYDLAPNIFPNATVDTFCDIFGICRSPSFKNDDIPIVTAAIRNAPRSHPFMGMSESMTNKTVTESSSGRFSCSNYHDIQIFLGHIISSIAPYFLFR